MKCSCLSKICLAEEVLKQFYNKQSRIVVVNNVTKTAFEKVEIMKKQQSNRNQILKNEYSVQKNNLIYR